MMSHQMNSNVDTDLDAFLNFDQHDQTPMSSSSDVKPIPTLFHQSSDFTSDAFSGPSYQYGSHRQQTGLPMGGYANTLAVNQASGLHYRPGNHGYVMPTETLNIPLSNLSDFDFNRSQFDMDVEIDSPADIPSMFCGENSNTMSPAVQVPQRIYPGMHTQQANQAKIEQAQRQQEMVRQQQQKQLPTGQRPLPTSTPKSATGKDPHVEESISRLLNRMRQSSTASADNEDGESPNAGSSSMTRIKKDEDDMDEDELLLNSEEGKKLSSKERRQLRNKVSARAFRSRRKEYITQLEAELGQKAQETNELRVQNRQLMEENTRLTDLTRMLLSSQAFSGFLQELSNSGVSNNAQQAVQQQASTQQAQTQPQATRKDIPTHEAARQMQNQSQNHHMQVGMTLIPETPLDMSIFDGHNSWNNMIPSTDFHVFSVMEMPEPPKIDLSSITEKPSTTKLPRSSQKDLPVISSLPASTSLSKSSSSVCKSDDLYAEDLSKPMLSLTIPTTLSTTLSKAAVSSQILASQSTSISSWSELQELCNNLEDTSDRISKIMC